MSNGERFNHRACFRGREPYVKPRELACMEITEGKRAIAAEAGSAALLEAQRRLSRAAVPPRDPPARPAPTSFEAQLAALRSGARLVERIRPRAREYDRTLGGVSEI